MNDFPELEDDLKALRPTRPSPVLFERIEEAMGENCRASVSDAGGWYRRFTETPYKWLSFGFATAAAAALLLLLARINTDQTRNQNKEIAQGPSASETRAVHPALTSPRKIDGSMASNKFIPSGATQVVFNTRNEGLQFADGSSQPLRRLRYQTQQTWQWRNPSTGASLRVSYPSEEVVLIPVSGQ